MNKKISALEAIAFHEEREHGIVKSRWWGKLKAFAETHGKFPPRLVFKAMVAPMYEDDAPGTKKRARGYLGPSRWKSLTEPQIKSIKGS